MIVFGVAFVPFVGIRGTTFSNVFFWKFQVAESRISNCEGRRAGKDSQRDKSNSLMLDIVIVEDVIASVEGQRGIRR